MTARRALAALLLAGCGATPAPAPPAPPIDPGLAAAEFFVGTWTGENVAADGTRSALTWTLRPALGGTWLAGEARVAGTTIEARDFWGLAEGGFVRLYVDSQGTRGTMRSTGWSGAAWVWEGDVETATGARVHLRETIDRVDDSTMRARYEQDVEGTWQPRSEETLRRR